MKTNGVKQIVYVMFTQIVTVHSLVDRICLITICPVATASGFIKSMKSSKRFELKRLSH